MDDKKIFISNINNNLNDFNLLFKINDFIIKNLNKKIINTNFLLINKIDNNNNNDQNLYLNNCINIIENKNDFIEINKHKNIFYKKIFESFENKINNNNNKINDLKIIKLNKKDLKKINTRNQSPKIKNNFKNIFYFNNNTKKINFDIKNLKSQINNQIKIYNNSPKNKTKIKFKSNSPQPFSTTKIILNNNFSNKKIINNNKKNNLFNYNEIIKNKKNNLIFNLSNDNIFNKIKKIQINNNQAKSNENKNKFNKTFNINNENEKVFNDFDIFKRLENTLILNSEKTNENYIKENQKNNNIKIQLKYEEFSPNFNDLYTNDRFSFKK